MDKVGKIFLINLERRPERREHFFKHAERENIPRDMIEIYKGIDGLSYNFSQEELSMFRSCDFKTSRVIGALMGNQLSHYNILKQVVERQYSHAIIFQDDVMLCKDFMNEVGKVLNNMPENAEIVWLGFHKHASLSFFEAWPIYEEYEIDYIKRYVTSEVGTLSYPNPCSLGYIVTLEGARNLVDYFDDVGFIRATDGNYNDYLETRGINYCSKKVLCTGNHAFRSDVFSYETPLQTKHN